MKKITIGKDLLNELYTLKEMTLKEIANEIGVNRQTIANKLTEFEIPIRNTRFKPSNKKEEVKVKKEYPYRNKETFEKVYREVNSIVGVAEYFEINVDTAFRWKANHGIKIKPMKTKFMTKSTNRKWHDKELLAEMYKSHSATEIAKIWGCDPSTICKWLKRHNISRSTHSEQWDKKSKFGDRIFIEGNKVNIELYKDTWVTKELTGNMVLSIKSIVGECQSCSYNEVLDLHHINEDREDNRPENHVILCPNCHAKIHRLGYSVEQLVKNYVSWETLIEVVG